MKQKIYCIQQRGVLLTLVFRQLIERILVNIVPVYGHINSWAHHEVMKIPLSGCAILCNYPLE